MEFKAIERPSTYPVCVLAWGKVSLTSPLSYQQLCFCLLAFDPAAHSPPAQWCAQGNLYLMFR